MSFMPLKSDVLQALINSGKYPKSLFMQMYVGIEDWQSKPENMRKVGNKLIFPTPFSK